LLAVMFLVAGAAKLLDVDKFRRTLVEFGAPDMLARPFAIVVPAWELVVAAALLSPTSAWWGALGALTLLIVFTAAIAVNLLLGRRPACNCFGQLTSAPIGWSTVCRNTTLVFAASWLSLTGARANFSALNWDIPAEARWPLLGTAVLGVAIAGWLLQLTRQNGRLLLRVEALEAQIAGIGRSVDVAGATTGDFGVGTRAPAFELPGLSGESLSLQTLLARGKRVLLVFSDPDCGPCNALMPHIGRWQRDYSTTLEIVIVTRGSVRTNRAKADEYGLTQILIQKDREVADAYSCGGTPGALMVSPQGLIDSELAMGTDAIVALVNRTIGGQRLIAAIPERRPQAPQVPDRSAVKLGERVPQLRLFDLKGEGVDLAGAKGKSSWLVFWNPACGFCRAMIDDLKRWEANLYVGAPRLILVSTGTIQENVAMGLRSRIILDDSFAVGQLFGASGTPSAVLLDAAGIVASELAVGKTAVMNLVGGTEAERKVRRP
jgi:peroxiredoxin